MTDLMKYNKILPTDDDTFHLWYDSIKGWRLSIKGDGNNSFNREAEVLFEVERERIIKLLEDFDFSCIWRQIGWPNSYESFDAEELIALIKGETE